jgi:hypothetical protein
MGVKNLEAYFVGLRMRMPTPTGAGTAGASGAGTRTRTQTPTGGAGSAHGGTHIKVENEVAPGKGREELKTEAVDLTMVDGDGGEE